MNADNFNKAHEEVVRLVKTFGDNLVKYRAPDYNESAARKDFIDKLFIALGWDVNHDTQTNPYEQEVKVERSVSVAARVKKADYAFFLKPNFGQERFFVEAKRPSAVLNTPDNCFQTIRYAFSSAKAALSILTNFNELYVIDCRFRPDIQTATNHIHKKFHFTDFEEREKFGELYYLFGREAVEDGALERYAETLPKPKGKIVQRRLFGDNYQEVDEAFLVLLEGYREELAKMFKRKNASLDSDSLTEAVQRTIDRLVFIRFLEDKLIEPSTILDKFKDEPHPWKKFIAKSREFDKTYNGIIFKEHPVIDRDDFVVDNKVFIDITNSLADKYSPYHFNYIPIHILGSIYERFLGSVIVATAKRATVEQKPEVRKAGGVFYTPQYIVKYIVENTIGALLLGVPPSGGPAADGKPAKAGTPSSITPADVAKMRFADIACGSGSFLLGAYEYLLGWHTKYYNEKASKKEAIADGCITNDDGTFALSFEQKKEILINNIYGVDIDRQAYEVTQLSLFLKLLEDETQGTKQQFLTGHRETMLPSLNNNIVCGNALVEDDIAGGGLFNEIDHETELHLNPMRFDVKFPDIMRNGGFDAIIGNPPYGAAFEPEVKKYLFKKYPTMKGQPESYEYFVERAIQISRDLGPFAYIVPTNFVESERAEGLRALLLDSGHIKTLSSFRYNVWKDNASETLVIVYEKNSTRDPKRLTKIVHPSSENEFAVDANAELRPQNDWQTTNKKRFLLRADANFIKKIESVGAIFGDVTDTSQGIIVYKTREDGKRNLYISNDETKIGWKKLLDTHSSLEPYKINWGGYFLKYGDWLWCPRENKYFEEPKIVFIRLRNKSLHRKLIGAYDDQKFYNRDNFNNIILTDKKYDLKYVLGLFNSKLLNYWYKAYFDNVNINPAQVRLLPFPKIDFANNADEKAMHDVIVRAVEQIMEAKPKLAAAATDRDRDFWQNKCDSLERTIDDAVYKLYNLTPDEITLVESS